MGKFFMYLATIVVIALLGIRNIRTAKRTQKKNDIFTVILKLIKEINVVYIELFKERSIIATFTHGGLIIAAEIFSFISVGTMISKYTSRYSNPTIEWIIGILVTIISIVVIHYSIGYILLLTSKINKFFIKVEDINIKIDLILSYFIISTYFAILVVFPKQFEENYILGLIGVFISYILTLKVLIKFIRDPRNLKSNDQEEIQFTTIIIASILILIMILLNLFLGVCLVNSMEVGAFSNNPTNFDLFYYTIITFTTIGYGDITPITVAAKIISMIISITSVVCITIFLSTVLSYKDEI